MTKFNCTLDNLGLTSQSLSTWSDLFLYAYTCYMYSNSCIISSVKEARQQHIDLTLPWEHTLHMQLCLSTSKDYSYMLPIYGSSQSWSDLFLYAYTCYMYSNSCIISSVKEARQQHIDLTLPWEHTLHMQLCLSTSKDHSYMLPIYGSSQSCHQVVPNFSNWG